MTLLLRLALLVAFVGVFVPLAPQAPSAGLDASWVIGMNEAVAIGLQFGRDIVFTFGPYSAVYSRAFHPATDALALGAGAAIAIGVAVASWHLSRRASPTRVALLVAAVAGGTMTRDAPMFAATLAAGLACLLEDEDNALVPLPTVAVSCVPLGLLPLVKGSLLVPCIAVLATVAAVFVLRGDARRAAAVIASAALTSLVAWIAAGQPVSGLVDFVLALGPIVSGYTDAMSLWGDASEPIASGIASAVVIVVAALGTRGRATTRLAVAAIVAMLLFVAFKASYVRHDSHALIAGDTLLLISAVLVATGATRGAELALVAAVIGWAFVGASYQAGPAAIAANLDAHIASLPRGLMARASSDGSPRVRWDEAIARMKGEADLPVLPGTVDIYSYDQASLIASDNRWNPRPVLQSYSAYTPALAEANRRHLIGPRAPDHLVFRVEPIDGRLPSLEDGASWPTLLDVYEPVSMLRDAVVLRRRATPADTAREAAGGGAYLLGERIAVPDVTAPLFAQIEVLPSLLGRVWALTFKPAPLRIELELEDGSQLSHRYVAAMGAAGFVISPWVSTSSEFAALYGDHVLSSGRRVVAFTVKAEDTPPASWRPSIAVRFERLSPRPLDDPPRFLIGDEPIAAPSSVGATLVSCDGHLDLLNGHAPTATLQPIGRTLRVSGWLSPDRERGVAPQAVLVVLEGEDGRRTLYATALSRRRDVAAHFGVLSLEATGFTGLLDASGLAGPQRLRLAFRDGEAIRVCESVAAVLVPALPAR